MQEGQRCPHCEEGTLEEKLYGDYDYLQCNNCSKKQINTIPDELLRYFSSPVEKKK